MARYEKDISRLVDILGIRIYLLQGFIPQSGSVHARQMERLKQCLNFDIVHHII